MDIKKKRGFRGQRAKIAARGGPRVQKNPDITNRDRFAQRLANFRHKVREFLTL